MLAPELLPAGSEDVVLDELRSTLSDDPLVVIVSSALELSVAAAPLPAAGVSVSGLLLVELVASIVAPVAVPAPNIAWELRLSASTRAKTNKITAIELITSLRRLIPLDCKDKRPSAAILLC